MSEERKRDKFDVARDGVYGAMDDWFRKFAKAAAEMVGHSRAFFFAALVVATWGMTGPICHFSDTWQLVINTGTTIVTFLMLFLIQNTQRRDAHAMHLKLDKLIRANKSARNSLLGLEATSDEDLARTARFAKRHPARALR
jgi:low affinity Fe/Cu permease